MADLQQEIERLQDVIERDRSIVATGLEDIRRAIYGYEWVLRGRGPYEWDDDDFRREFGRAVDAIRDAMEPLRQVARDWSDCPRDWGRIQKARAVPQEVDNA